MITILKNWITWGALSILLIVLVYLRLWMALRRPHREQVTEKDSWVYAQTTGNKEVQADCAQIYKNNAGTMAVLADGIGKENTGKIAAQVAADSILDVFEPYYVLKNPEYFLQTAFKEAHTKVQITLEGRRGGASTGAVFMDQNYLYYGLAGNIRIALLRNGELIPLSKGHTMDVLAKAAYEEGRLSRQEAIWSMEESGLWNYLGMNGFSGIEVSNPAITVKAGDIILMASKGIYEEVSFAEMEDILIENITLREKAECIVMRAEQKGTLEKDNGSVILLTAEVSHGGRDEKSQF